MADKITVELDASYAEHLWLLKQIIPNAQGEEIKEDGKMVEALIDSFMAFIQEQAAAHQHDHGKEGGWCGSGCGCSH